MEVYDLSEENELDTYMSREVPVPEGDEAQSLTQEELGQGQEDHYRFNHKSTCTTDVFPKNTENVWFLDQAIWREEHNLEYDLNKTNWRMWISKMQRPYSNTLQGSLKSENNL